MKVKSTVQITSDHTRRRWEQTWLWCPWCTPEGLEVLLLLSLLLLCREPVETGRGHRAGCHRVLTWRQGRYAAPRSRGKAGGNAGGVFLCERAWQRLWPVCWRCCHWGLCGLWRSSPCIVSPHPRIRLPETRSCRGQRLFWRDRLNLGPVGLAQEPDRPADTPPGSQSCCCCHDNCQTRSAHTWRRWCRSSSGTPKCCRSQRREAGSKQSAQLSPGNRD